jgi:hypothetical protein
VISWTGLDFPHNFRAFLDSFIEINNPLVPEAIKSLVDQLPISEQSQTALLFASSITMVLCSHLLIQLIKFVILKGCPQFYNNFICFVLGRPRVSAHFLRSFFKASMLLTSALVFSNE